MEIEWKRKKTLIIKNKSSELSTYDECCIVNSKENAKTHLET